MVVLKILFGQIKIMQLFQKLEAILYYGCYLAAFPIYLKSNKISLVKNCMLTGIIREVIYGDTVG